MEKLAREAQGLLRVATMYDAKAEMLKKQLDAAETKSVAAGTSADKVLIKLVEKSNAAWAKANDAGYTRTATLHKTIPSNKLDLDRAEWVRLLSKLVGLEKKLAAALLLDKKDAAVRVAKEKEAAAQAKAEAKAAAKEAAKVQKAAAKESIKVTADVVVTAVHVADVSAEVDANALTEANAHGEDFEAEEAGGDLTDEEIAALEGEADAEKSEG